jgi:hypothetical protein
MKIIGPPKTQETACRKAVEGALAAIYASRRNAFLITPEVIYLDPETPHTKARKRAARQLSAALRRVRQVLVTHKMEEFSILRHFPEIDYVEKLIGLSDDYASAPATRKGRDEPWKRDAVRRALMLLREFSSHKTTVTPNGPLNRLIGALLGKDADYTFLCKRVLHEEKTPWPEAILNRIKITRI